MDAPGSPPPRLQIVLFPWLAFGQVLPYLELIKRLGSRGHHVSYVSTSRSLARLPLLRQRYSSTADLVPLMVPRIESLPDGTESSNDIPGKSLYETFDALAASFVDYYLAAACAAADVRPYQGFHF
ncbi:unnamed protein product [Urochloa humidicola]